MFRKVILGVALCAFATSAFAQTKRAKPPRPQVSQAQNDTLSMSCAQAHDLVLSKPKGVVLKTGPNRFDLYVHDAEACSADDDLTPAFVRTKNIRSCFIGYTCEDLSSSD